MKSKIEQIIQKAINTNCNLEANEYLKNAMNLVYNDKIMTNQEKIFGDITVEEKKGKEVS